MKEIKNVIEKIAQIRRKKGYTYENMAHELKITPAAYRKIETGETKLTVERLIKISEILGEDLFNLLEMNNKKTIHYFSNEENDNIEINNNDYKDLINYIRETHDKLIKTKDEQIAILKEQIHFYKENKK
ncbi:helix-turn-helix transcriptional regulator [Chryseobacterium sp.]|uniref:helix-turn-helix domain-containing protein n=1 Tax=Chryseobacterium sp. TaxID=1871047 RepID=UPI00289AB957|nr:helix-turn-helix transcriptional regulator [Chryseobacterium sp.]